MGSSPKAVRRRLSRLADLVAELDPGADAARLVASGEIEVDGLAVTNPDARIPAGARVRRRRPAALRGQAKLSAALAGFGIEVTGRVALDVGAAAGGFTRTLLEAGARRVYAVDAGHGQLRGSLRQDPRVVNLEATNVADLTPVLVPEPVEVVSIDVSYLSLSAAAAQLDRIHIAPSADLVGLVKPMFELRRATAPIDDISLAAALTAAIAGVEAAGWAVVSSMQSPVLGARGARELLLHARRGVAGPPR
jgi:23S rRNA (cytidine1920-2'-O)/16S rRNA (cytidine1409-2'-O)-methyltransferase